jgi:hypothetical protein
MRISFLKGVFEDLKMNMMKKKILPWLQKKTATADYFACRIFLFLR